MCGSKAMPKKFHFRFQRSLKFNAAIAEAAQSSQQPQSLKGASESSRQVKPSKAKRAVA